MSKKFLTLVVTSLFLLGFTTFSLSNALAMYHPWNEETAGLTGGVKVCKAAKKHFKQAMENAKAKALSMHLSKKELKQALKDIKDFRKQVCLEADPCFQLKKDVDDHIAVVKYMAKGLTAQLSKEEAKKQIKELQKNFKKECPKGAGKKMKQ